MKWKKYTIATTTEAEDLVSGMLMELGMEGVLIEDNVQLTQEDMKAMFIDILPEVGVDEGIGMVSFFLEMDENGVHYPAGIKDDEDMYAKIQAGLEELTSFTNTGAGTISTDETEDKDWMNNWKKYFKPFCVNDIIIKPSWEEVPSDMQGEFIVEIDPGTAFGTGSHETTRLVILQMEQYITQGTRLLDVGTGSGILSVIGLLLGAEHVTGTEIDPIAVNATIENLKGNHMMPEQYTILGGNIITDDIIKDQVGYEKYDVVTANILAGIIILLLDSVADHMKMGGVIITSGIIDSKESDVKNAFETNPHFEIIDTTYDGEWVSITAKKVQ